MYLGARKGAFTYLRIRDDHNSRGLSLAPPASVSRKPLSRR
ncbi:hypothetical protein C791_6914 [Amycolatopsis azurea DSM 43854]|uniref:Uncharacterized protein n=1 Tax=Amycolatopsis azurea DSM 43854 TaxID=1238180 RepID=M2QQL4_9PSEU|nr:hypothetical protein C791_6914 [Amycolatopsis azurea DSM 43854]